jgi:hypothetical protein
MKTGSKHTKGPWKFEFTDWRGDPTPHKPYVCGNIGDGSATAVCIVEGNPTSEETTLANARLIAAAPSLLEALREQVQWYDDLVANYHPDDIHLRENVQRLHGPRMERSRAAIALAQGAS